MGLLNITERLADSRKTIYRKQNIKINNYGKD